MAKITGNKRGCPSCLKLSVSFMFIAAAVLRLDKLNKTKGEKTIHAKKRQNHLKRLKS